MAVDGLATVGVAVVTLVGGYIGGRQKASGDLAVAREETARLRQEAEQRQLEHRMGVYHNIANLASMIDHSITVENSVYRGAEGWAIREQFNREVDGLAVFGASEPRRYALTMREALQGDDVSRFQEARAAFLEAAHRDVGPAGEA